jgi:hypothetical protein
MWLATWRKANDRWLAEKMSALNIESCKGGKTIGH